MLILALVHSFPSAILRERDVPEPFEVGDHQRLDVLERQVALLGLVGRLGEDLRHEVERLVLVGLALLGAAGQAVLERVDALERRTMRALVVDRVRPDGIADGQEPAERVVEILERHLEGLRVALLHVLRVGAGEAVRLLLGHERREPAVEDAVPRLHSVTELVGHDDGERVRPELVEELVRQVVGVPRNEVALRAVEGVLSDVLVVGGSGRAAVRRRIIRSVRDLAPGDRGELAPVQLRELGLVERLRVVDGLLDDRVVIVRPEALIAGGGVAAVRRIVRVTAGPCATRCRPCCTRSAPEAAPPRHPWSDAHRVIDPSPSPAPPSGGAYPDVTRCSPTVTMNL